jgi:hypothetical protein
MSRVATYSGPFLRGIVAKRMAALGYSGEYDASLYDSNPISSDPNIYNLPGLTNGPIYPAPTLGPTGYDPSLPNGGFSPPATSGPLAFPGGVVTNPNATLPGIVQTSLPGAIQAAGSVVASALVPRPSPVVQIPLTASTIGMWMSNNLPLVLGGVAALLVLSSMGGRRR